MLALPSTNARVLMLFFCLIGSVVYLLLVLQQTNSHQPSVLYQPRQLSETTPTHPLGTAARNTAEISRTEPTRKPLQNGLPSLEVFAGTPPERCDCSKLANQRDYATVWMRDYLNDSKSPFILWRKQWELAYVYCNIMQKGACREGETGLVFAVGKEKLPSVFVSKGCNVHATDFPSATAEWNSTDQQSFSAKELYMSPASDLYSLEEFQKKISFQGVDMNKIPADLLQGQFSFLWSTCSVEHVGNIELGKIFVLNAMGALKPNGIAVHTTEFNLASLENTITEGQIAMWRAKDILDLEYRLCLQGDLMLPPNFQRGEMTLDLNPDEPPWTLHTHIKLVLGGYTLTSFGFVIIKGGNQNANCALGTFP